MIPKVLIVYHHRPQCAGLYYRFAFRQAGCEVRTMGPSTTRVYGKGDGTADEHEFAEGDFEAPWCILPSGPLHVQAIYDEAVRRDYKPDLVVMVDQYDPLHLVGELQGAKFVHISVENWNPEQRTRYESRRTDAEFYCIAHSNEAPPPNAGWFPFGADPFVHPLLNLKRDKLVCQIGTAYEPRPEIWNALRAYFDGEPPVSQPDFMARVHETQSTIFGRIPSYQGMAEAYNQALCAISSSNVDFVPMRAIEAFAMGCVLLSDDVPTMRAAFGAPYAIDMLGDGDVYFDDAEGIWIAHQRTPRSIAGCIEYVRRLAREDYQTLVQRAFFRAYSEHLYYHRAKRVLESVGLKGACRLA